LNYSTRFPEGTHTWCFIYPRHPSFSCAAKSTVNAVKFYDSNSVFGICFVGCLLLRHYLLCSLRIKPSYKSCVVQSAPLSDLYPTVIHLHGFWCHSPFPQVTQNYLQPGHLLLIDRLALSRGLW